MHPVLVLSHEDIEPKLATRHFRVNLDASFCEPQSRIRTSSIVTLRNLIFINQTKNIGCYRAFGRSGYDEYAFAVRDYAGVAVSVALLTVAIAVTFFIL